MVPGHIFGPNFLRTYEGCSLPELGLPIDCRWRAPGSAEPDEGTGTGDNADVADALACAQLRSNKLPSLLVCLHCADWLSQVYILSCHVKGT